MSRLRLIPLVAMVLAAAFALVRRRRGAAVPAATGPAGAPAPSQAPAAKVVDQTYRCECGQEFRVQGEDRHRVYWLTDAAVSDPVLDPVCPSCERPLPHEHEHPAA